ncbi:uncharacterized protein LOC108706139 [Xenopus laevis]|uniref:Uncharacterized protein LOC108706139 n=1 Tax=Xenopus laevis TaxID=8355 RepID=A0A8J1MIA4_XENLA|nr:uncharacterized protein LOC108706139 [Xenopus laevis]
MESRKEVYDMSKTRTVQKLDHNRGDQLIGDVQLYTTESSCKNVFRVTADVHNSFDSLINDNTTLEASKCTKPAFVSKLSLTKRRAAKLQDSKNNSTIQVTTTSSADVRTYVERTKVSTTQLLDPQDTASIQSPTQQPAEHIDEIEILSPLNVDPTNQCNRITPLNIDDSVSGESANIKPTHQCPVQQSNNSFPRVKRPLGRKTLNVWSKKHRSASVVTPTKDSRDSITTKSSNSHKYDNRSDNWYTWYTCETDFWYKLREEVQTAITEISILLGSSCKDEILTKGIPLSNKLYITNKIFGRGLQLLPHDTVSNLDLSTSACNPVPTDHARDLLLWLLKQCRFWYDLRSVTDTVLDEFQRLETLTDEKMKATAALGLKNIYIKQVFP